jgi:hypothetical protein
MICIGAAGGDTPTPGTSIEVFLRRIVCANFVYSSNSSGQNMGQYSVFYYSVLVERTACWWLVVSAGGKKLNKKTTLPPC